MERKEMIKTVIELHNFFIIEWSKSQNEVPSTVTAIFSGGLTDKI